jgi:hypothetical protein
MTAIAGVRESVGERFALVQEAVTEVPDIGQMKMMVPEVILKHIAKTLAEANASVTP